MQQNTDHQSPITDYHFPKIMGIVNVTPDSFSDGGKYNSFKTATDHALKLIDDGADILDIGGESTRPGAAEVSADEEIARVVPVIEAIRKVNSDIPISIDTTKYDVALKSVEAGATMINDISALKNDERLGQLAALKNLPLILMHMQGVPRTMQQNPQYDDVVQDVFKELAERIQFAQSLGVKEIIADVGIGFGKTVEHNWQLLKFHAEFLKLGVPLLLGISRKSFIGKSLGIDVAAERDIPTALLHAMLLKSGAGIIRVHDVKIHSQVRELFKKLNA